MNLNTKEHERLRKHYESKGKWLKWGPYLSERQWGTVREDYSPDGEAWRYFTHHDARSRAYRWGEDGIAGISDRYCNVCFGVALWNGQDSIIKERLFGLGGHEGNHGEDVKELYYYLDNTPTHSYMKHLYKYPQAKFPYDDLRKINQNRGRYQPEYEILDTGIFDDNRYFDVVTEYAKAYEEDILIKITAHNRSVEKAPLTLMPTLWLRNLWSFGLIENKPSISIEEGTEGYQCLKVSHDNTGDYFLHFHKPTRILFTENETNPEEIYGHKKESPFVKDAFHSAIKTQDFSIFEGKTSGTKCSLMYELEIEGGDAVEIWMRLSNEKIDRNGLSSGFENFFEVRKSEADEFYESITPKNIDIDEKNIHRQALAGMLWTKQYYNIDVTR